MRILSSLLSLALLTFSCASAPKTQPFPAPSSLPDGWTAARDSLHTGAVDSTLETWWVAFQDERLNNMVDEALRRNFSLQAAADRVDAAQAQAKIAGAPLYPQANLNFGGSKRRQNFIGFPIPGQSPGGVLSTTSTSYGVSTDVSWEIDLWGRMGAGKAASIADYQVAQADHRGAQLSISAQTSKAWFAAIEARRQLELAQATLDNFRAIHAQIQNRYERGVRPPLDMRLSLSNVHTAEAVVAQRRQALDSTIRQVEILLGRYPSAELAVADDLPPMPGPAPAGLPADLIARRPDLVAAERLMAAAGARVKEAKRAQYPRISLTGSTGTTSADLSNLLNGDFFVWSFAGNLLQPLFQGGRLRAGVSLAEAGYEQSMANLAELALRAYAEVETALSDEAYLATREQALQEATAQALAARDQAEDRYARGLSDVITLLEAQRRAFDIEGQYIAARRLRLETRVDLYLALGGDFGMK